jgi:hypothetical protein
MTIDLNKLEKYKQRFLEEFPDNKNFEQPRYLRHERSYKLELCDAYREEIAEAIANPPDSDVGWVALGKQLGDLFRRPLDGMQHKPQNLVGWRYWNFERLLNDPDRIVFARAVVSLLDESKPVTGRIQSFQTILRSLAAKAGDKCGPSMCRSVTTFFLFLSHPNRHVFIKTREFRKALLDLSGVNVLGEADEYEKVLGFVEEIRKRLQEEGWKPKDLIDVQSLLWVYQKYDSKPVGVAETAVAPARESTCPRSPAAAATAATRPAAYPILDL